MLHIVLGDGGLGKREMHASLNDLVKRYKADDQFWVVVQGKAEPTSSDIALMDWVHQQELYYEVITSDKKAMDKIYANHQAAHEVKQLAPKVVSIMDAAKTEGEDAALLTLFVSNDEEDQGDLWLVETIGEVLEAGYKVYALNDGLAEITAADGDEDEEAAEDEEVLPPPAAKSKGKAKLAAVPDLDEPSSSQGWRI